MGMKAGGRGTARARALALAALLALLALLGACGSQATGQPLSAIHANADSWSADAVADADCLGCHNGAALTRATQGYDGADDVNVHEPPATGHSPTACASCHRVEAAPVLACNQGGCHAYTLPEGWSAQG
ncbi:MAG: cytochrome c3 family protein [Coriobacteriales bacterium]|jgi:hypothetical protein|nr:cytochrome c3 family protein [Coriobacteriales bacterium]